MDCLRDDGPLRLYITLSSNYWVMLDSRSLDSHLCNVFWLVTVFPHAPLECLILRHLASRRLYSSKLSLEVLLWLELRIGHVLDLLTKFLRWNCLSHLRLVLGLVYHLFLSIIGDGRLLCHYVCAGRNLNILELYINNIIRVCYLHSVGHTLLHCVSQTLLLFIRLFPRGQNKFRQCGILKIDHLDIISLRRTKIRLVLHRRTLIVHAFFVLWYGLRPHIGWPMQQYSIGRLLVFILLFVTRVIEWMLPLTTFH